MYKRFYRRKYLKPKYRKGSPKKRIFAKRVAKICKRVITKRAEKREAVTYQINQDIVTAMGTPMAYVNLCPQLQVGSARYQRSANEIRVTSQNVQGVVHIMPIDNIQNQAPAPVMVKMFLYKYRTSNLAADMAIDMANNFFTGQFGPTGPLGTTMDLSLPVNRDDFILYKTKTFRLGVTSASNAVPSTGNNTYFDNSPMCVKYYFNTSKYIKKLKYPDNVNLQLPTNDNLYLAVQVVDADGVARNVRAARWDWCVKTNWIDT